MHRPVLVIACGALAREIADLKRSHGWNHLRLKCLDAKLHNRPDEIPRRVREAIRESGEEYARIFVAYADCGTGGALDRVLEEEGVERLPGAHCYQLFAGSRRFSMLSEAEPGTFYLTDFLARHFDRLVVEPLGLDEYPDLRDTYFGNYTRLVYLSQTLDAGLVDTARRAAERLALAFEHVHCGFGELESELAERVSRWDDDKEDLRLLA
ncbi:MAG: DUF1638 domain-containing protein [Gammaproteobacteria bacterium]|nr:DUF1638 domain-containing protein [Gammaproteobacteria bacterium]